MGTDYYKIRQFKLYENSVIQNYLYSITPWKDKKEAETVICFIIAQ